MRKACRKFVICAALTAVLPLALCSCTSVALINGEKISVEELIANADIDEVRKNIALPLPVASGSEVYSEGGAQVDASNASDGYIMISCKSELRHKVRITFNDGATVYDYDLVSNGEYQVYPLQSGSGSYNIRVLEQVEGDTYSVILACLFEVALVSEESPFLYPNVFVDYDGDTEAVLVAYLICDGAKNDSERLERLYGYVANNIAYDLDKADSIYKGYVPDVDDTLNSGSGICFDYASLLACMLRSVGIPARLAVGEVSPENALHAWNQAYIDGVLIHMDATFNDARGSDSYTVERIY